MAAILISSGCKISRSETCSPRVIVNIDSRERASNYFEIRSKAAIAKLFSMNEYITRTCVYYPPWESNLLRFQYYFVGVQFHWLMLMQAISLYRSRPDPRESVRNSSSVYQDTRYQDFPLIAMSGYPLKNWADLFILKKIRSIFYYQEYKKYGINSMPFYY